MDVNAARERIEAARKYIAAEWSDGDADEFDLGYLHASLNSESEAFDELEELRTDLEQARILLAGALGFLKERDCPYREAWVVPQIREFLDRGSGE